LAAGSRRGGGRVRSRLALARFGELHGPVGLIAGVDLEEAGAVITMRQAVADTGANHEFLVARAHECLARPLAAAVVVDRIDVVVARRQRAPQDDLASAAARQIPPPFGGPPILVLVADGHPDPAGRVVADAEIG